MVALMPAKRDKGSAEKSRRGQRAEGTKDVFARLPADVVDRLDEIVEDLRPRASRSAVVASLIEQYVAAEYPRLQARRQAQGN